MTRRLPVHSNEQLPLARRAAADLATEIGFSSVDRTIIATVVSELGRNILIHGGGGEIVLDVLPEGGILIIARDKGPGLVDVPHIFQRGHGLWAVRQGVDDLVIEPTASGRGTRVQAKKWLDQDDKKIRYFGKLGTH